MLILQRNSFLFMVMRLINLFSKFKHRHLVGYCRIIAHTFIILIVFLLRNKWCQKISMIHLQNKDVHVYTLINYSILYTHIQFNVVIFLQENFKNGSIQIKSFKNLKYSLNNIITILNGKTVQHYLLFTL